MTRKLRSLRTTVIFAIAIGALAGPRAVMAQNQTPVSVMRYFGDKYIEGLLKSPDATVWPATSLWDIAGFEEDVATYYARHSMVRQKDFRGAKKPSSIGGQLRVPPGKYYFGFTMYRTGNNEGMVLRLGKWGDIPVPAGPADNRMHLYLLDTPYPAQGGEKWELVSGKDNAICRIENFVVFTRKPEKLPDEFRIYSASLFVNPDQDAADTVQASLAWNTSWSAKCSAKYGIKDGPTETVTPDKALCNHRIILSLKRGAEYAFEIQTEDPYGKIVKTALSATADLPRFAGAGVKRKTVTITVENSAKIAAQGIPMTVGIPLPTGELGSPENVRIMNPAGEEIPLQVKSESRWWKDMSIKWLLLDFQADVKKDGASVYTLEYGSEVRRKDFASPLKVEKQDGKIVIHTGAVRLELSEKGFDLFRNVTLSNGSLVAAGGDIILTDTQGKTYHSNLGDAKAQVELAGPERVVVKLEGSHQAAAGEKLMRYVVYMHAYRNKPFVRVFHTWEVDNAAQGFTEIKNLSIEMKTAFDGKSRAYGAGTVVSAAADGNRIALEQPLENVSLLVNGQKPPERLPVLADGWLDFSGDKCGVAVSVRDFKELYPKSLACGDGTISVGICPDLRQEFYPRPEVIKDADDTDRLYYYLLDGKYKFRNGMSKRHETLFYFHGNGDKDVQSVIGLFQNPPLARAPAKWYGETFAAGPIAAKNSAQFPLYESIVADLLKESMKDRREKRLYGMLNYGDWFGESLVRWGNNEYDNPWAYLLEFMRGGDPQFFHLGGQAAEHMMNVDFCRYGTMWLGGVYTHFHYHVGGYDLTANDRGLIGVNTDHVWSEGMFLWYLLTGDTAARESGAQLANRFSALSMPYEFGVVRDAGWQLILIQAAYEATGDPYYLNAARMIADRVLERQDSESDGVRNLDCNYCQHQPRCLTHDGFQGGVLLHALARYHRITGDPRVAEGLVKFARYYVRSSWVEEEKGFLYETCPGGQYEFDWGLRGDFYTAEGLGYASYLSGDQTFLDIIIKGTLNETAVRGTEIGKRAAVYLRGGPAAMWYLEKAGKKL